MLIFPPRLHYIGPGPLKIERQPTELNPLAEDGTRGAVGLDSTRQSMSSNVPPSEDEEIARGVKDLEIGQREPGGTGGT